MRKAEELPSDMAWLFIGPLQTNKARALSGVPNLALVKSVDHAKVATALNCAVAGGVGGLTDPLFVILQFNTSREDSKSGCKPGETAAVATLVLSECEHLCVISLMTIGAPDLSDEPAAFLALAAERDA